MSRLQEILMRMRDVDYVKRPLAEEDLSIATPEEEAMGEPMTPPAPPPNPAEVPLKPGAFNGMESVMNLATKGDETPLPEAETQIESPARKKLRYLDTMNQAQKMRSTPLKPLRTLAGGYNA